MTQAQSYEAWRITYQSDEQAARSAFDTAEMLRQELLVARAAITSIERDVSQALTERDDATDFIDKILDEVLGQDRHEWTSAYDLDDALADVEAKIAALKSGKCLHQIAEPAVQGLDIPDSPHLGDHWKANLLDGRTLERDEKGMGWHPALPSFDEATDTRKFYEAFGMEICQVSAESELEWEEYDRLAGLEPNGEFNFSEWTPKAPEGEGWKLVSIHDTEDGPYAWWLRDKPVTATAKHYGI